MEPPTAKIVSFSLENSLTLGTVIMHLFNYASKSNSKINKFPIFHHMCIGALVSIVVLHFQWQTTHIVGWKLIKWWVHSLCRAAFKHTMSTGKHGRHLLRKDYNSQRTNQWTRTRQKLHAPFAIIWTAGLLVKIHFTIFPYAVAVLENVGGRAVGGSGCVTHTGIWRHATTTWRFLIMRHFSNFAS